MKKTLLKAFSLLLLLVAGVQSAAAQETVRQIYFSDITDWAADATEVAAQTRFEKQAFSISISGDAVVEPTKTTNSRTGHVTFAAGKSGAINISAIKAISSLEIEETVGRGGGNGICIEVKGDGDADWVKLLDETVTSTSTKEVAVERKNVAVRITNINESKALYLCSLKIKGNVSESLIPTLGTFSINGNQYDATALFTEQNDGTMAADIQLSKKSAMVGDSNPIADAVATAGTVKGITYEGTATACKAVITVGNDVDDVQYVANISQKPDCTVNFVLKSNNDVVETRTVEQDSPVGAFPEYNPGAQMLRGVFAKEIFTTGEKQNFDTYRKISTDEIITKDVTFYLIVNDEETSSDPRHEYQFADHINGKANNYFYMEDHEGIEVVSGQAEYSNAAHGWLFKSGTQVKLQISDESLVAAYLCSNTPAGSTITLTTAAGSQYDLHTVGSADAKAAADNMVATQILMYEGESATLTFNGDCYVHAINVTNELGYRLEEFSGYMTVAADDVEGYLAAVEIANGTEGGAKIFLPDGTYDLGERVLTTITNDNVSIVGQSMEKTIIKNAPLVTKEGINLTATLRNNANDLYLQDLTLQNDMPYYNSTSGAGRGVALLDQGKNTICKNVRLLSYQDTYYSHKASNFYWEDSEIHGTVDYLCGDGDVVYNRVKLVNENRQAGATPNGSTTVAAPYTSASCKWGYVFLDCTIDCKSATFNLGRSWGGESKLNYIRTTLLQPQALEAGRFTASGMNVAAFGFYEYGTMDAEGNNICPESKVINFTHSTGNREYETILTADQAAQYTVANIYGEWAPDKIAAQIILNESMLENESTIAAALSSSDAFLVTLTGSQTGNLLMSQEEVKDMFTPDLLDLARDPEAGLGVAVRAANGRGGFGPALAISTAPDAIASLPAEPAKKALVFNLAGQRVADSSRGLLISNGKKYIK